MLKLLIVEDDAEFLEELLEELPAALPKGTSLRHASNMKDACAELERFRPDFLLTDMIFPESANGPMLDEGGVAVIDRCQSLCPDCRVVVLSSRDRDFAVSLLVRRRIHDYLFKDMDWEEIGARLAGHGEAALRTRRERLRAEEERDRKWDFLGGSPATRALLAKAERVAPTEATVLLLGESGTGKEVLARWIHHRSSRQNAPFVALNCGALDEDLVRSELFGHVKGAFTGATEDRSGKFELAHGGTLFLDEVGELSPANQVRLLRVLEERSIERVGDPRPIDVDVRLLAATNRDLEGDVREGRFREDLFFRLHVFPMSLPPLRERKGDALLLARRFLSDFARVCGKAMEDFAPEVEEAFEQFEWPGNVRQLRNAIEYAVILATSRRVERADLPAFLQGLRRGASPATTGVVWMPGTSYQDALADQERLILEEALRHGKGDTAVAADCLAMPQRTLQSRLKRHGLKGSDYR